MLVAEFVVELLASSSALTVCVAAVSFVPATVAAAVVCVGSVLAEKVWNLTAPSSAKVELVISCTFEVVELNLVFASAMCLLCRS